ncbi:uncharacterized protein ASCRUDRAFT_106205 [Ascoidea rubescens DSM 1968]|uniref:Uncharacterized protein n=1 Tax=Ascoidea rubescens DSM 1968 TaxID=1344418 RepID=A0A1D2VSH0_9ASCO|nr:hypothetical protein ASCRUDRAFT_106205 [Ascoidea rubescens DSM 1968]ODV64551.1 hypothetical protein ASCRUDRAFT_106205 [Ascoidea rubescens DSM 1968]
MQRNLFLKYGSFRITYYTFFLSLVSLQKTVVSTFHTLSYVSRSNSKSSPTQSFSDKNKELNLIPILINKKLKIFSKNKAFLVPQTYRVVLLENYKKACEANLKKVAATNPNPNQNPMVLPFNLYRNLLNFPFFDGKNSNKFQSLWDDFCLSNHDYDDLFENLMSNNLDLNEFKLFVAFTIKLSFTDSLILNCFNFLTKSYFFNNNVLTKIQSLPNHLHSSKSQISDQEKKKEKDLRNLKLEKITYFRNDIYNLFLSSCFISLNLDLAYQIHSQIFTLVDPSTINWEIIIKSAFLNEEYNYIQLKPDFNQNNTSSTINQENDDSSFKSSILDYFFTKSSETQNDNDNDNKNKNKNNHNHNVNNNLKTSNVQYSSLHVLYDLYKSLNFTAAGQGFYKHLICFFIKYSLPFNNLNRNHFSPLLILDYNLFLFSNNDLPPNSSYLEPILDHLTSEKLKEKINSSVHKNYVDAFFNLLFRNQKNLSYIINSNIRKKPSENHFTHLWLQKSTSYRILSLINQSSYPLENLEHFLSCLSLNHVYSSIYLKNQISFWNNVYFHCSIIPIKKIDLLFNGFCADLFSIQKIDKSSPMPFFFLSDSSYLIYDIKFKLLLKKLDKYKVTEKNKRFALFLEIVQLFNKYISSFPIDSIFERFEKSFQDSNILSPQFIGCYIKIGTYKDIFFSLSLEASENQYSEKTFQLVLKLLFKFSTLLLKIHNGTINETDPKKIMIMRKTILSYMFQICNNYIYGFSNFDFEKSNFKANHGIGKLNYSLKSKNLLSPAQNKFYKRSDKDLIQDAKTMESVIAAKFANVKLILKIFEKLNHEELINALEYKKFDNVRLYYYTKTKKFSEAISIILESFIENQSSRLQDSKKVFNDVVDGKIEGEIKFKNIFILFNYLLYNHQMFNEEKYKNFTNVTFRNHKEFLKYIVDLFIKILDDARFDRLNKEEISMMLLIWKKILANYTYSFSSFCELEIFICWLVNYLQNKKISIKVIQEKVFDHSNVLKIIIAGIVKQKDYPFVGLWLLQKLKKEYKMNLSQLNENKSKNHIMIEKIRKVIKDIFFKVYFSENRDERKLKFKRGLDSQDMTKEMNGNRDGSINDDGDLGLKENWNRKNNKIIICEDLNLMNQMNDIKYRDIFENRFYNIESALNEFNRLGEELFN